MSRMPVVRSRRVSVVGAGILAASLALLGFAAPATGAAPQGGITDSPGADSSGAVTVAPGTAPNSGAPRAYFPADVTSIPATGSLPDLFTFFSPSADPNHSGTVDNAAEWGARRAELSDLMQYYLYGYKHPTPAGGSVFGQQQIPASTTVNLFSVFDFSTFSINLPAGSYTVDFSTFTITPVLSFVATQAYDAPGAFQDWDAGDTWTDADHASLLVHTPASTRTVVNITDPGAPGNTTATIRLDGFE